MNSRLSAQSADIGVNRKRFVSAGGGVGGTNTMARLDVNFFNALLKYSVIIYLSKLYLQSVVGRLDKITMNVIYIQW